MADEVLKLVVTADTTKAQAAFKSLADASKMPSIQSHPGLKDLNQQASQARTMLDQLAASAKNVGETTVGGMSGLTAGVGGLSGAFANLGTTASSALTAIGGPLKIMATLITANAAAVGAMAALTFQSGVEFSDTMAKMSARTGVTGEVLQSLGADFLTVFGQVPQTAAEVGDVMTSVNQRFGLTGPALQEVTRGMLNFSRVTGTPVKAAMDALIEVMSSWDVKAAEMPHLMDMLTVAFQRSGVNVQQMAGFLENNDAALKQFGFGLTEAIALIATLQQRGVNVTKIMTGLNTAAPRFAEAGIDPQQGFDSAVAAIRELDNETGLLIAKHVFGTKVATEFADAIRSGAFDTAAMTIALQESDGALDLAAQRVMTLSDLFDTLSNSVKAVVAPLGGALVDSIMKYTLPAFAILIHKLTETTVILEYLLGLTPTISSLDLAKATHTGLGGAAPAMGVDQIAQLSGKGPAPRRATMGWQELLAKMKKTKSAAGATEKPIDPAKFDADFRRSELQIFQTFDRASDQFDKNWSERLRGTADRALKALQEEEKVANELEENNKRAAQRTQEMEDKLALIQARTAGRTRAEGEIFELLEQQRQERRGVEGHDLEILDATHQAEQLALMQRHYDDTFSKIKNQAEGVFDAIFTSGKKGFAGLLDFLKATFFTKLKDLFGDLVATLFTGQRPGGGREGGLFGSLFSRISGLFDSSGTGGAAGGFGARLKQAFGFGGLAAGGATRAAGGAAAVGELALPTSIFRPETAAGAGSAAGAGGSFFGLSGAKLAAFFTNPYTIAAGIGIAATIAFLKLRKTREEKFRAEILRDFALNVPDSRILKQIKQVGESVFGKEADKKRHETLRLNQVQGLLLNYATASGQDPSRLPLYQRFHGTGLAARSLSFDPSKGIPAFGSGGIITRPTFALVGEKGPEMIVPLSPSSRGGVGGAGINVTYAPVINIPSGVSMNREDFARMLDQERRKVTDVLAKAIRGDHQRGNILSGLVGVGG